MKVLYCLVLAFSFADVFSQVEKRIVVEHFTNTYCSVCATRNPGFYDNLSNFPDVVHLAVHPSAPYDACSLNQHNVVENDARTNYYNVYGSTPRLVVQGVPLGASEDYSDPDIFIAHAGQESPFTMEIFQNRTPDSVYVDIKITRVSASNDSIGWLYAALTEKEITFNAPNGEEAHPNVFRKSLFGNAGQMIELPTFENIPKTFYASAEIHEDWDINKIFTTAILQQAAGKAVIQANENDDLLTGIGTIGQSPAGFSLFPNPAMEVLNLRFDDAHSREISIIGPRGGTVYRTTTKDSQLQIGTQFLQPGFYVLTVIDHKGMVTRERFIKL